MSRYLATGNPEAAARMNTGPIMPTGPMIHPGMSVRFFPRRGDAPGNLTEFALYVTRVNKATGTIDGMLMLDSRDFRDMNNVPYNPDHEPYSWDYLDQPPIAGSAPVEPSTDLEEVLALVRDLTVSVSERGEEIVRLREDIASLERRLGQVEGAAKGTTRREPKPTE